ncbi:MAG TPA: hypothetical protein VFR81_11565 [Longimicrobium sp.]|nr:hypothetical protein [Longimicrobium sp.]
MAHTAADLRALQEAISPARLGTYLRQTHYNARRAIALYEWNVRAGAALLPILQANEVALRNAVHAALTSAFEPDWPTAQGFLRSLPSRERAVFEAETRKLRSRVAGGRVSAGDVVAGQTYWFWVFLLTSRFQNRVWNKQFAAAFPYAPKSVDRAVVHARCETIRLLRNRIAHHEPLLKYDLPGAYQRALSIVRWISPVKALWAAERWPLGPEITSRP